MKSRILIAIAATVLMAGCAQPIKLADKDASAQAKLYKSPSRGKAGLYVYRSNGLTGGAARTDLWVDGRCLGTTQASLFLYTEVEGNQSHRIATQSEFSDNHVDLVTETGKLYFVRQYMKVGLFRPGANVEVVTEANGKYDVSLLDLAVAGECIAMPTGMGASPAASGGANASTPDAAAAPADAPAPAAATPATTKRSKKK